MPDVLTQNDKAGKDHWNTNWADTPLPPPINPDEQSAGNHIIRNFHALFKELFSGICTGKKLLEIGCARSVWLPYFAKHYGFDVSGIDYSKLGCQQAIATLNRESISGNVVCCDFHFPPAAFIEEFDVVVSFGVVEHYSNTKECIESISKYVRPGGRLITIIPNMTGIMGYLQKYIDISVYRLHVPLSAKQLKTAHEKCGLVVEDCKYFMSTNFGVLNTSRIKQPDLLSRFKTQLAINLSRASRMIGALENRTLHLPAMFFLAPYIVCVCRKT
ncbi:MAG: class I SAM-dependent methyltransferase [Gammaproteobacteria bacterium]|nr:class I SAM-dependent methyltransferase [Gammaproteobacteria bacterium]